jgi:Tfp pilus assembly protein PilF
MTSPPHRFRPFSPPAPSNRSEGGSARDTTPRPFCRVDPQAHPRMMAALGQYAAAIAELNAHQDCFSVAVVERVLQTRSDVYTALAGVGCLGLAQVVYLLCKALIHLVLQVLDRCPRWMRYPVLVGARSLHLLWYGLPKWMRHQISYLSYFPGFCQIKKLVQHLIYLSRIDRLDKQFYRSIEAINHQFGPLDPALWQRLAYPPNRDVFGFLVAPQVVPWRDRLDVVWEFLSIIVLTAAVAILVNISTRLFSDGPDAKGIQEIILPSLLTLLAGSGLTRTGREAIGRVFDAFNAPKHWRDEFIFISILLVFLGICNVWRQLPDLANQQTQAGHNAMCFTQPSRLPDWIQTVQNWAIPIQNSDSSSSQTDPNTPPLADADATDEANRLVPCVPQLARAESAYRLAIKLDGDNTEAHYGLGRVYEALQQQDFAIAQYQLAVKGELRGLSYKAYDRLGRLFVLKSKQDKDDSAVKAIAISKDGLDRLLSLPASQRAWISTPELQDMEYALYKNLGWAYLMGQENLGDAKSYLEQAKTLIHNRAPAHCLLAQVYDQQQEFSMAETAWEHCIRFARGSNQNTFAQGIDREEEQWFSQGRDRLKQIDYDESIANAERLLAANRPNEAYPILQTAIALLRDRAPAYCLMAQVDEQRGKPQVARTHWELCAKYARLDAHDRDRWLPIARDRLTRTGKPL